MAEPSISRDFQNPDSAISRPSRRFRFDKGSRTSAESGPARTSLLGIFGGFGGTAKSQRPKYVPERRATDRVHHVECLAWVGWKTFRNFSMNDALLVDISRGGARIFLDKAPPSRRPVWVYLETPGTQAVVRAKVIDSEMTPQGQCVLRIEFEEPCPYQFFEAAVCGLAASNPKARSAAERRKVYQGARELAG